MGRLLWIIAALAIPCGALGQAPAGPELAEAARTITVDDLRQRLGVIAHDSMGGRDTPSPGLDKTAAWIADNFGSFGLEPVVDGGFIQRYRIATVAVDMDASGATVSGGGTLDFGSDLGFPFGPQTFGDFSGSVVLVSGSRGASDALAAAELAGKHVVLVTSPGRDGAWSRNARRLAGAIRRSADPASVIVATDRSSREWDALIRRQEQVTETLVGDGSSAGGPVFEIRDSSLAPLLEAHGASLSRARGRVDAEVRLQELPGLELTVSARARVIESFEAPNVVGVLPGSDPELRDEYVLFSAHMDHEGIGIPDQSGDSIYNGADDNGSGTVTIVELAEAYAQLPRAPRRSMMFLLVSAEEDGLLGSEYFAENPPVPLVRVVAGVNMDMVGRNWEDTIVAIGKEHSDLGRTLAEVNERHPELNMNAIDDLWPEERFYTRSDHFNFARKGVPILFFFNGIHEDYHEPSDEVDKIKYDKMARIGRLLFYLGHEIANRDERPRWNPRSYEQIVEGGE